MGGPELALHQLDGAENRPFRATGAEIRRPGGKIAECGRRLRLAREQALGARGDRIGVDARGPRLGDEAGKRVEQHLGGIFARARQRALAEHARRHVGAAQLHVDRLLDIIGTSLLDHEHGALSRAELAQLLGHERKRDVEHVDRYAARAVEIGEIESLERAQHPVGEPSEDDDADLGKVTRDHLVELARADEPLRGGKPLLDLAPLLRKDDGRMRQPAIVKARRTAEAVLAGKRGAAIGFGLELAGDVAGADAQLHHHRRMARFGQLETFLDHAHDRRQIRARIDEPDRGLHGIGV